MGRKRAQSITQIMRGALADMSQAERDRLMQVLTDSKAKCSGEMQNRLGGLMQYASTIWDANPAKK